MRHLPLGAPVDVTSRGRTGNLRRALKSPDQVVKITAELMGKVALIGQRCWTGLCRDGSEVSLENICCLLTQPATEVFRLYNKLVQFATGKNGGCPALQVDGKATDMSSTARSRRMIDETMHCN